MPQIWLSQQERQHATVCGGAGDAGPDHPGSHDQMSLRFGHSPAEAIAAGVDSQSKRAQAEEIASTVLNVQQVVNELQVKAQKATSSN
jgi:hypothetical protein